MKYRPRHGGLLSVQLGTSTALCTIIHQIVHSTRCIAFCTLEAETETETPSAPNAEGGLPCSLREYLNLNK